MDRIGTYYKAALILLLSGWAYASYQPITGSTVTVYPTAGVPLPVQGTVTSQITGFPLVPTGVNASTTAVLGGIPIISTNTLNVAQQGLVNVTGSTVGVIGVYADSSSFTLGTTPIIPIGGVFYSNPGLPVTSTTTASFGMTRFRSLYVTPIDFNGVALGTSTTNPFITNVTGSTIGVVVGGVSFPIISTTTLNVAQQGNITINSPAVTQSGTWNVTSSTVGVVVGGVAFPIISTNTLNVSQQGNITINSPAVTQSGTWNVTSSTVGVIGTGGLYNVTGSTIGIIGTGGLYNVTGSTVGVLGFLSNNGIASGSNRVANLPAIAQNRYAANGTGLTTQRDAALVALSSSGLAGVWSGPDITFQSYSASTSPFTVQNSTVDFAGICGNAINTVLLYSIRMSCTQTTAGTVTIAVAKRSSQYSNAISTIVATPQDANYAVSVSTVNFASTGGANGTLVSYLDNQLVGCMATGTASPNDIYISPASWRMKPIVLRGTQQCVGIGTSQGVSISGGKFAPTFEWMEVSTP